MKKKWAIVVICLCVVFALFAYFGSQPSYQSSEVQSTETSQPIISQSQEESKQNIQVGQGQNKAGQNIRGNQNIPNSTVPISPSANDLLPDPNQYVMNSQELQQNFKDYVNSNQQNTNGAQAPVTNGKALTPENRSFLEQQKREAKRNLDDMNELLKNTTLETLKPSIRQSIIKQQAVIDRINALLGEN